MVGVTARGVESIDDELVDRIRRGDAEAFRALVDRNRDWLVARCRRHLGGDAHAAEDVAQECFVSLQRTLVRTDRPMAVRPWLSVVARNRCIDETRKKRATPTPVIPDSAVYDAEVATEDPHLARAWAALTGRHRAVLELRELGGMSYDEIAIALAVTSGAVETLLFRARTALRREYARAGGKVAAMGPMEEAVQRATGGRGMLTRLAEQAGARFGDGASVAAASSANGQALAGAASQGGTSAMSAGTPPSWLLDLQARLASSGLLDPLVHSGAGGGRLRVVLAGVGALLATVAVTAPTIDDGAATSPAKSSPPAAVTVPAAPEAPAAPSASAPTTPSAPASPATTTPTPPTAPAADAPPPPASAPPTPIASTVTTVVGTVGEAVDDVVEPVVGTVEDAVNAVLGLPR